MAAKMGTAGAKMNFLADYCLSGR